MSTNDQPHAEVTPETNELCFQIYHSIRDFDGDMTDAQNLLADFCAKREAHLSQQITTRDEFVEAVTKDNEALHARESLVTESNDALAAQVVKLTERAEMAEAVLLEIKQRVTADEDFSADEIIELINGLLGRNAISKAWCMDAAHKETMEENANLRELVKTLATAIERFWNTGQSLGALKAALADARKAGC